MPAFLFSFGNTCALTVESYSTAKMFPSLILFREGSVFWFVFWFVSGIHRAESCQKQLVLSKVKVRAPTSMRSGQTFHAEDKGLENS